ncbi:lactococcin 972 family bacteriocin [Streptomyces coffeae]|uniref:lactococcin 972 family bacteriocin n=1 Tax=Streptomyces coffeae TaxID=621382 RepID=UPI0027DCDC6E|nr:lactococcin 972 family bacteriocin [Streptomyces coffeae]
MAADGSGVGQVTTHKRGDGTKPPAELGNPSEWGVVKIEMDASAGSVRPDSEACVPASGGKWCYGWNTTTSGKYCYSNYLHGSKRHSSKVKIAGVWGTSGPVKPGLVSNAHRTAGLAYTCYSYYNIL